MQVLTPSGYRSPLDLGGGAEVCAFDAETGAPIINHIENIDVVDYAEWCRWWQVEDSVPAFKWVRVNGSFLLFGEQSIWRNGTNVCHAKHLTVGDEIYNDADQSVTITSIEVVEDNSLIWYRFDIDGDHSYIVDGLTVHNASRYWVGGTGSLDGSTTTHIASSSGGAGGASYPGSSDSLTLNSNSGGGTVTFAADHTLQSIDMSSFGGTLDNSSNNNNITLVANNVALNANGSATQTLNMGGGTWTISGVAAVVMWTTANSSLTLNAGTSTLAFTGIGSDQRTIQFGTNTYNSVSLSGAGNYILSSSNTVTVGTLTLGAGVNFQLISSRTFNVTSLVMTSTLASPACITASVIGSAATIGGDGAYSVANAALRDIAFSGANTRTLSNGFDLGHNSGITITPPGSGGGGVSRARAFGGV